VNPHSSASTSRWEACPPPPYSSWQISQRSSTHTATAATALANLEAGLIGGRLYLAAYAQRFGATGLTFYDRDVVSFFSPHAAGKDALFVTALGRSVKGPAQSPAPMQISRSQPA